MVFGDLGVDEFRSVGFLAGNSSSFVGLHEPGVPDHVGGEDCSKSTLFTLFGHSLP
jgi:hypothetical protein